MKSLKLLAVIVLLTTQAFPQARTWVGTTSTSWTESTNWSPNGVPDSTTDVTINTGTYDPVLSGNVKVNRFTMNSGTFDLNGYTFEAIRYIDVNGGTIEAGLLYARQLLPYSGDVFYMDDAVLNCDIDVRTPRMSFNDCVFNDTVKVEHYAGWVNTNGGNVFNEHVHIIQSGAATKLGSSDVDSLKSTFILEIDAGATGSTWLSGSSGLYLGDDAYIRKWSSGGSLTTEGDVSIDGDLHVGAATGTGVVNVGLAGYPVTISAGHSLKIDTMGYDGGPLKIYELTQVGSAEMDLSEVGNELWLSDCNIGGKLTTSSTELARLYGDNVFNGEVELGKVTVWQGATFHDKVTINASGTTGNNVFMDTVDLTVTTGQLLLGFLGPDTAYGPVTLHNMGTNDVHMNNKGAGSYFAGKVTVYNRNSSNRWLYMSNKAPAVTTYHDIELNRTNGQGIYFFNGTCTVNGGITVGDSAITTGKLYFHKIDQAGSDPVILENVSDNVDVKFYQNSSFNGHVTLEGGNISYLYQATFNGGANLTSKSIPANDCHFGGDTYFTKTGTTNNLTKGNYYGGSLTVTNESNTNYIYLGYQNPDTVMGDLTLSNNGSALLWAASTTELPVMGDVTIDGNGEVRCGHPGVGDYLAFESSGNQTITIGDSVTHRLYRMQVDKPSGNVILKDSLVIDEGLSFSQGRIICQDDGMVTIWDNGTVTGVTDSTYVEGPVKKVGNDAFDFPVGRQGHYMPISLSAPGATTDEFVAEYFNEDVSEIHDFSSKDSTLVFISTNEYWTLNRTKGTSDETVTLSWDETSCDFDTLANLMIAAWDTANSKWVDLGNGATSGDTDSGNIDSDGAATLYSYYALASKDTLDCVPCRADAGEDKSVWFRYSVTIGTDSIPGFMYQWNPFEDLNSNSLSSPIASPLSNIDYHLETTNMVGCKAEDRVTVEVRIPPSMPQCIGAQ